VTRLLAAYLACAASASFAGELEDGVHARVSAQRDAAGASSAQVGPAIWKEGKGPKLPGFVPPTSLAPLVKAVRAGVVNISTENEGTTRSLGSGFVISADGLVVTNNHVVAHAQLITVKLADGRDFEASLIGRDPETDLALLHLEGASDLHPVVLGDSDELEVGDWVVAIGNPFGLDTSVTNGLISARERVIGMGPFDDFLQTNALVNPGNSGGPLFDMRGEVVGVTTAIVSRGQGIGFAAPINLVKELLPNLRDNGRVERGWIGISAQEEEGAPDHTPVVTDVYRDSPAQKAGVLAGDRVVSVDGKPVERYQQLLRKIAFRGPGATLKLGLSRRGKPLEVSVTLASRPAETAIKAMASGGRLDAAGFTVREVDPQAAKKAGIDRGLRVEVVTPGSPAELAGLAVGDILTEVNRQAVGTVSDLSVAWGLSGAGEGVLIKYRRGDSFRYVSLAPR
jgi:serine protease Do